MSLLSILFGLKKCTHDKMGLYSGGGYCPDCGEYVENQWYLVRCSCCGVKRVAITRGNTVLPQDSFCTNCGEQDYYVEKLNHVNFIDINYATVVQIIHNSVKSNQIQSWVEPAFDSKLLCSNIQNKS